MVVKDLKEQPESEFILLTGAGKPVYYAVDSWHTKGDLIVEFFRQQKCVYACRVEGTWAVVARSEVNLTDDRTLTVFQMEDSKTTEAFYEKLDPEMWAESKKAAMNSMGLGHLGDDRPAAGQYL